MGSGELLGRKRVARAGGSQDRQARVGHHHHGNFSVLRKLAKVLTHFLGTGSAIETNHVDPQWFQCSECGINFRAHEHGSRSLHRDLNKQGQSDAGFYHGYSTTVDGRLRLQ